MQRFVQYIRVSTASQGKSRLGLEAQKTTSAITLKTIMENMNCSKTSVILKAARIVTALK